VAQGWLYTKTLKGNGTVEHMTPYTIIEALFVNESLNDNKNPYPKIFKN